jgi:hypothetical protein
VAKIVIVSSTKTTLKSRFSPKLTKNLIHRNIQSSSEDIKTTGK